MDPRFPIGIKIIVLDVLGHEKKFAKSILLQHLYYFYFYSQEARNNISKFKILL